MTISTFNAKIADIEWTISHRYPHVKKLMDNYIISKAHNKPIPIVSTEEGIEKIHAVHPEFDLPYCESDYIYQTIAEQLPGKNRILMHGAAITYGADAFLFTAPGGTGKTTHISLWHRYLEDGVDIVNGDKPILALDEDVFVYGTPWGGKENWQKNRKASLRAIVLLKQAAVNSIERVDPGLYIPMLMQQVYLPQDEMTGARALELLDELTGRVPFYLLRCDISEEAVRCSFEKLTGLSMEEVN